MAKIRGIKPEFWTDEDIVDLSLPARLLFIGLWNLACDNGHVTDKPKQIKMRVLPADDVDVDLLLDELEENGRLQRKAGTVTIHNFAKHQKPHRRWWTVCDLEDCGIPDDAPEQGFNRGGGSSHTRKQPGNNSGATVDHGRTTADVDGEGDGDSEGEVKNAPKRAHQLPADFTPNDANRNLAEERGLDLPSVVAQFSDHHRAKGNTFKDWHLALNTWLRREKAMDPPPSTVRRLPHASEIERAPSGLTDEQMDAWLRGER